MDSFPFHSNSVVTPLDPFEFSKQDSKDPSKYNCSLANSQFNIHSKLELPNVDLIQPSPSNSNFNNMSLDQEDCCKIPVIKGESFKKIQTHSFNNNEYGNNLGVLERKNTLGLENIDYDFNKVSRIFSENNSRMDAAMIFENFSNKTIHTKKHESSMINYDDSSRFIDKTAIVRRNTDAPAPMIKINLIDIEDNECENLANNALERGELKMNTLESKVERRQSRRNSFKRYSTLDGENNFSNVQNGIDSN